MSGSGVGLGVVRKPAMFSPPPMDIGGFPNLAHGKFGGRRGEVGPVDELLNALAADAKQLADLGGPYEVVHVRDHRQKTTSHLTRGPAREDTSRVTSSRIGAWHPRCIRNRQLGSNCQHAAYHGIGCEEYAELVAAAQDRCQICGISGSDTLRGELCIDHLPEPPSPAPHKVRGLVCDKCNSLMSKVDGRKPWDADRTHEEAALRYAANAWYLTHPIRPPHLVPDEITDDVKFGFMGYASTARVHALRHAWTVDGENRAACGNKLWLPAHPDVVRLYTLCVGCRKANP